MTKFAKLFALLLCLLMILSFAACEGNNEQTTTDGNGENTSTGGEETTTGGGTPAEPGYTAWEKTDDYFHSRTKTDDSSVETKPHNWGECVHDGLIDHYTCIDCGAKFDCESSTFYSNLVTSPFTSAYTLKLNKAFDVKILRDLGLIHEGTGSFEAFECSLLLDIEKIFGMSLEELIDNDDPMALIGTMTGLLQDPAKALEGVELHAYIGANANGNAEKMSIALENGILLFKTSEDDEMEFVNLNEMISTVLGGEESPIGGLTSMFSEEMMEHISNIFGKLGENLKKNGFGGDPELDPATYTDDVHINAGSAELAKELLSYFFDVKEEGGKYTFTLTVNNLKELNTTLKDKKVSAIIDELFGENFFSDITKFVTDVFGLTIEGILGDLKDIGLDLEVLIDTIDETLKECNTDVKAIFEAFGMEIPAGDVVDIDYLLTLFSGSEEKISYKEMIESYKPMTIAEIIGLDEEGIKEIQETVASVIDMVKDMSIYELFCGLFIGNSNGAEMEERVCVLPEGYSEEIIEKIKEYFGITPDPAVDADYIYGLVNDVLEFIEKNLTLKLTADANGQLESADIILSYGGESISLSLVKGKQLTYDYAADMAETKALYDAAAKAYKEAAKDSLPEFEKCARINWYCSCGDWYRLNISDGTTDEYDMLNTIYFNYNVKSKEVDSEYHSHNYKYDNVTGMNICQNCGASYKTYTTRTVCYEEWNSRDMTLTYNGKEIENVFVDYTYDFEGWPNDLFGFYISMYADGGADIDFWDGYLNEWAELEEEWTWTRNATTGNFRITSPDGKTSYDIIVLNKEDVFIEAKLVFDQNNYITFILLDHAD